MNELAGSSFCPGCGRHVALVATDTPNVLASVDFKLDGYTPSAVRHLCGELARINVQQVTG